METATKEYLLAKKVALEWIENLFLAIKNDDVPALIHIINSSNLANFLPQISNFIRNLLISSIKTYIEHHEAPLIVSRKAEYNIDTKDYYRIKDNELIRNGHSTKWDSIGKLYQAYKQITTL